MKVTIQPPVSTAGQCSGRFRLFQVINAPAPFNTFGVDGWGLLYVAIEWLGEKIAMVEAEPYVWVANRDGQYRGIARGQRLIPACVALRLRTTDAADLEQFVRAACVIAQREPVDQLALAE